MFCKTIERSMDLLYLKNDKSMSDDKGSSLKKIRLRIYENC